MGAFAIHRQVNATSNPLTHRHLVIGLLTHHQIIGSQHPFIVQPLGANQPTRLLIGHHGHLQAAVQWNSGPDQRNQGHNLGRHATFVVAGAPAINAAIFDLAAERVGAPQGQFPSRNRVDMGVVH